MKVFALGLFAKPLTDEQRKRILPKEVPDTLRLYLDGKIDQFWFREDKPGGVVFLMNSTFVKKPSRLSKLCRWRPTATLCSSTFRSARCSRSVCSSSPPTSNTDK